jgi:hypothetical protein
MRDDGRDGLRPDLRWAKMIPQSGSASPFGFTIAASLIERGRRAYRDAPRGYSAYFLRGSYA